MKFLHWSFVSVVLLCLDLLSKYFAQEYLLHSSIFLLGNWLRFDLHYNFGIAFSLPVPWEVQILLSIVIFVIVGVFIYKNPPQGWVENVALGMIAGGALGNFYERIVFGKVTDFIAVWKFPVFNAADSFLFVGVVLTLYLAWMAHRKEDS